MEPFKVNRGDAVPERIRTQLRGYRLPPAPEAAGWRYGCDPEFLRELCAYWADGFDFRAAEAELNRFPQVMHRVDGIDIHAVHLVGEAEGRRPLLLTHGWPGSVYEFWQVAEELAFPSRHGGNAADAFDLVIPSLPGFGCSGKPAAPIGARSTARLFDRLMRDGFGYDRYLAQGGDWGRASARGWRWSMPRRSAPSTSTTCWCSRTPSPEPTRRSSGSRRSPRRNSGSAPMPSYSGAGRPR